MKAEFFRYIIAGIVNTAVGYAAFFFLLRLIGLDAYVSNFISYGVGLCVAFILNKVFVFKNKRALRRAPVVFLAGFAVSYFSNICVLYLLVNEFRVAGEISQLFAMAVYTVSFYIVNRLFVFSSANDSSSDI